MPDTPDFDAASGPLGRRFVIVSAAVVLLGWGGLWLAFRDWREGYRERAEFGAGVVAPAVDPLAATVPPGVDPKAWRRAVAETHAMLLGVIGANLLSRPQMERLADRIKGQVASTRPETALATLADIWDHVEPGAGPAIAARHPRPGLLPQAGGR